MNLSSRKRRIFHDEDAMTAMNDIMFFLMLFFLIISTLANPNVIKLLLPKSSSSTTIARQPVTITVTQDHKYYLNTEEIPLANLEKVLNEATIRNDDKTVILRIAKNLTIQDLVDLLDVGARLNLKMVMNTSK
jgi:biopolymer transport protein ExbD